MHSTCLKYTLSAAISLWVIKRLRASRASYRSSDISDSERGLIGPLLLPGAASEAISQASSRVDGSATAASAAAANEATSDSPNFPGGSMSVTCLAWRFCRRPVCACA